MKEAGKYIAVIHGPNLNRLGRRDTSLYGNDTLEELCMRLERRHAAETDFCFFQSNHEGALIDRIQSLADDCLCTGIIINPGAYAHTSLALADALADFTYEGKPYVEVHISDIMAREPIRRVTLTGANALKVVSGLGADGYDRAVEILLSSISKK